MIHTSEFVLPPLTLWRQNVLLTHARRLLEAQQKMTTEQGNSVLLYLLNQEPAFEYKSHYPRGDRIDHHTGAQYFYHCHRENFESREHGHFHCFMRYKQIPKRIKPTALDDWDIYIDNPMTHLIAIGINQLGQPIRLFTVNRWVTSEIVYDATHIPYFLKRYKMTLQDDPYWQVLDQWIEGILHLFAPQIAWLHREREQHIQSCYALNPHANHYMDYELEELSEITIDIKQQVDWIIQATEKQGENC